ncbi:MAG: rhodanese-like domain-containing protein [Pricia sp.]|nr:rhodanese-like domain-containing protein [Pricia sp.]
MKKISILLVLLTVMTSCISQNKTDIQSVDLETMKTEVVGKDAQLIDVRTPEEFSAGHIDGAVNINYLSSESFTENINKLDKTKPVYVYCQMGGRSK